MIFVGNKLIYDVCSFPCCFTVFCETPCIVVSHQRQVYCALLAFPRGKRRWTSYQRELSAVVPNISWIIQEQTFLLTSSCQFLLPLSDIRIWDTRMSLQVCSAPQVIASCGVCRSIVPVDASASLNKTLRFVSTQLSCHQCTVVVNVHWERIPQPESYSASLSCLAISELELRHRVDVMVSNFFF
jgi:hypothetical protein